MGPPCVVVGQGWQVVKRPFADKFFKAGFFEDKNALEKLQ